MIWLIPLKSYRKERENNESLRIWFDLQNSYCEWRSDVSYIASKCRVAELRFASDAIDDNFMLRHLMSDNNRIVLLWRSFWIAIVTKAKSMRRSICNNDNTEKGMVEKGGMQYEVYGIYIFVEDFRYGSARASASASATASGVSPPPYAYMVSTYSLAYNKVNEIFLFIFFKPCATLVHLRNWSSERKHFCDVIVSMVLDIVLTIISIFRIIQTR